MPTKSQEVPHDGPEVYLGEGEASMPLVKFDEEFNADTATTRGAKATVLPDTTYRRALRLDITAAADNPYPGVTFHGPEGGWDLSAWQYINADIENTGPHRIALGLRADNPGAEDDPKLQTVTLNEFAPGERKTISLRLYATEWALTPPMKLVGMRKTPGQSAIDARHVQKLILFSVRPEHDEQFIIRNVRAQKTLTTMDSATFLPFVDRYGQFIHAEWPGKIKSDHDFIVQRDAEDMDVARHSGPKNFNRFGGWIDGPQLEATGSFRVTKHQDKWWLVDPEGRLFWSHGVDCIDVRFGSTGVEHREEYFAYLPDQSDPLAQHYQMNTGWAPHGFYNDKLPYRILDFQNANLQRKYGDEWREAFAEKAHLRLRSWGMNTIGAWGAPAIYRQQRTAYTTHVWITNTKPILGSTGYWGQFPDVLDQGFRDAARRCIGAYEFEATDPWNIGYYIDNEMAWGDEIELSLAVLASPADQAAKQAFIEDLQSHHRDIKTLNDVWASDYTSWDELRQRQDRPKHIDRARPDLTRFYQRLCETYFRIVKEEIKRVAPDKLYLGCRFAWKNPTVLQASATYCDVVSYNVYKYSVRDLKLPHDIDRPIIIGEFSFGSSDAGTFPSTTTIARDQQHRGELYRDYVDGALDNPQIIGTHWFQYTDQVVSGRPDEENFNVGMISITDQPHRHLIQAVRNVGYNLYKRRSNIEDANP